MNRTEATDAALEMLEALEGIREHAETQIRGIDVNLEKRPEICDVPYLNAERNRWKAVLAAIDKANELAIDESSAPKAVSKMHRHQAELIWTGAGLSCPWEYVDATAQAIANGDDKIVEAIEMLLGVIHGLEETTS